MRGLRTHDGLIPNSLQSKFISQTQIYIPLNFFVEIIVDYMENHGLETHNDKMYAKSTTGNTTNTPQFIWPKSSNFFGYF